MTKLDETLSCVLIKVVPGGGGGIYALGEGL